MKKLFLIFFIVLVLAMLAIPDVSAKKMFAPDLTISRVTLDSGSFTVTNKGSKNSPTSGFDVLVYYQRFDGSTYKKLYHTNRSIARGYSRSFTKVFSGGKNIKTGLIRVNPYKRFQEWDYSNNIRYFSLIKKNIPSYVATEQARYDGGSYWYYKQYGHGYAFADGNSSSYSNRGSTGGYEPLLSVNPIAQGYNWWNSRRGRWEWKATPLYVNCVDITASYGSKRYTTNYVAVSGVAYTPNIHIYANVGFAKELTYNAVKGIWEGYVKYKSAKLRDSFNIKIYSNRLGQNGTNDIIAAVSNVKVWTSYIKNSWSWNY